MTRRENGVLGNLTGPYSALEEQLTENPTFSGGSKDGAVTESRRGFEIEAAAFPVSVCFWNNSGLYGSADRDGPVCGCGARWQ
jgi:hypothetical protein